MAGTWQVTTWLPHPSAYDMAFQCRWEQGWKCSCSSPAARSSLSLPAEKEVELVSKLGMSATTITAIFLPKRCSPAYVPSCGLTSPVFAAGLLRCGYQRRKTLSKINGGMGASAIYLLEGALKAVGESMDVDYWILTFCCSPVSTAAESTNRVRKRRKKTTRLRLKKEIILDLLRLWIDSNKTSPPKRRNA